MDRCIEMNVAPSLIGKVLIVSGGATKFPSLVGLTGKAVAYNSGFYLIDFGPEFENASLQTPMNPNTTYYMHDGQGCFDTPKPRTHFYVEACDVKEYIAEPEPKTVFNWDGEEVSHREFWDNVADKVDQEIEDTYDEKLDEEFGEIRVLGRSFSASEIAREMCYNDYEYDKEHKKQYEMREKIQLLQCGYTVTFEKGFTASIDGKYYGPNDTYEE